MFTRFLLILVSIFVLTTAEGYHGYKIYEITPQTRAQTQLLYDLSTLADAYDFLTLSRLPGHAARVMVDPQEQTNLQQFLREHQLSYNVVNENVGATIERDVLTNKMLRRLLPYNGEGRLGTERYYSFDEIISYIEDLASRYPARVNVKAVGKSYEGRILKTITITNGDGRANKNVIFMDGGFHAREWISPAAVIYAIEQLVEKFAENADLLLDYDWLILPVVNADGYEYTQISSSTRMWRKTRKPLDSCIGTDPNRNFDFHWNEEGASSNPCSEIFAGPQAFSEPETVVVRDLMHTLRRRGVFYLTLHSYGSYILYPWGWSSDLPDTWPDLHEVAEAGQVAMFNATGRQYTIGSSTNVLYVAAGASDDYAFQDGFKISFTMELPAGGNTGFDPPPSSIDSIVKETWIGIRAMAEKVQSKYPTEQVGFL